MPLAERLAGRRISPVEANETGKPRIEVKDIVMKAGAHATVFLFFERPPKARVGTAFPIEVTQLDEKRKLIGGLSARVEIVPAPREEVPVTELEAVTAVPV